jgi:hypothetical protein
MMHVDDDDEEEGYRTEAFEPLEQKAKKTRGGYNAGKAAYAVFCGLIG